MQRAIEYCPDTQLSGLGSTNTTTCSTANTGNEDIYFATILRGMVHNHMDRKVSINAQQSRSTSSLSETPPLKLPSMLEAAYFSTETLWLTDVIQQYHVKPRLLQDVMETFEWWDGKYPSTASTNTTPSTAEDGRARFRRLKDLEQSSWGKKPIVPIGLHKFWKYDYYRNLLNETESYEHLMRECPYLKDILP
jgi:hypothetical protein